jgi:PASTA domain
MCRITRGGIARQPTGGIGMLRIAGAARVVSGGRRSAVFAVGVMAVSAFAAFSVVPSPAAASCSHLANLDGITSYGGTASMSYVTGPVVYGAGTPAQFTISLDRRATNLQIAGLKGGVDNGGWQSMSQPTGGTISINDTYNAVDGGMSHQTANGPTVAGGNGNGVQLQIDSQTCTYQVLVTFGITTSTDTNNVDAPPDDTGAHDGAMSPALPIPSTPVFQGSAKVPAPSGTSNPNDGGWDMSSDPTWGVDMDIAANQNAPETASFSWDLKPSSSPHSSGCVVPKVAGRTQASAKKALTKAGCKVGKISKKGSSKVAKGKVISSKPKAGTKLKTHARVALVVSSGKPKK